VAAAIGGVESARMAAILFSGLAWDAIKIMKLGKAGRELITRF
jgi:hypothetical protein